MDDNAELACVLLVAVIFLVTAGFFLGKISEHRVAYWNGYTDAMTGTREYK